MKFKRVCYVVAEGSLLCGKRVSQRTLDQDFEAIAAGECDAALMSITVGGAGVNCQTMNRIVFMEPPTTDTARKQAKGHKVR
jgi:hypothetical protein